jgi:predicted peroxiredoxin
VYLIETFIRERGISIMAVAHNILIIINTGPDKKWNHYTAYTVAWVARKYYKVKKVTIMYGPYGAEMTKKGTLATFTMTPDMKELTASQFEGLKAEKLPDHLEQLGRFERDKMGISIVSCGQYHVLEGFAQGVEDRSNMEDFIDPIDLYEACKLMLEADQILYY